MTRTSEISLRIHEDGHHEVVGCMLGESRLEFLLPLPYMYTGRLSHLDHADNRTVSLRPPTTGQYYSTEQRRSAFPGFRPIQPREIVELFRSEEAKVRIVLARIIGNKISQLPSMYVDTGVGSHPNGALYSKVGGVGRTVAIASGAYIARAEDDLCVVVDQGQLATQTDQTGNITIHSELEPARFDISRIFRKYSRDVGNVALRDIDRANPEFTEYVYGCEYEDIPDVLRDNSRFWLPRDGEPYRSIGLGIGIAFRNDVYNHGDGYMTVDHREFVVKSAYIGCSTGMLLVNDGSDELVHETS